MDDLTKWRLILGGGEADGTGQQLKGELAGIDEALSSLYEFEKTGKFGYGEGDRSDENRRGGSGASSPTVSRWLGDIRKYFPASVVEVMQNDAMKHPQLRDIMIFEPEILEKAEPDVNLVATLMQLGKLIPAKTKDTARRVVEKVVEDLLRKLEQKTIASITGAINKSSRKQRPKHNEINWHATILKNLKHYQSDYKTIIPETLIGYGRKSKKSLKDIILCVDQSGSMGNSVVYSGILGAVIASLHNVKTHMVMFDTEVADLTAELKDPVDLLFGVQLGGGTDINLAVSYCQDLVTKPTDTIMVMITDLYEGGNEEQMLSRINDLVFNGVQVICLLALDDKGSPYYDKANAERLAAMGIPVFACTPDKFPDMMAAAIQQQDINRWYGENYRED